MARSTSTTTTKPDEAVEPDQPTDGPLLPDDQRDDGLDAEPPMVPDHAPDDRPEPMTIPEGANYLILLADEATPNDWKSYAAVAADGQESAIRGLIKSDADLADRIQREVVWLAVVPKRSWAPIDVTLKPREPVLTLGSRRQQEAAS